MKNTFKLILIVLFAIIIIGCSKKNEIDTKKEDKKEIKEEKKEKRVINDPFVSCSIETEEYNESVKIYYNDEGVTILAVYEKYEDEETAASIFEIYDALSDEGMECELDGDTMIIYMTPDYIMNIYTELTVEAITSDLTNNGYVCE